MSAYSPDWTWLFDERKRQDSKWGEQNHDAATWLAILTEEIGEVAQAVLGLPIDKEPEPLDPPVANLTTEVQQVAAVAVAWVEAIARARLAIEYAAAPSGEAEQLTKEKA